VEDAGLEEKAGACEGEVAGSWEQMWDLFWERKSEMFH
jgi:hypothetical protein